MRPLESLYLHCSHMRGIALQHRVRRVRVFGTALHVDETADSNFDLLGKPAVNHADGHWRYSV